MSCALQVVLISTSHLLVHLYTSTVQALDMSPLVVQVVCNPLHKSACRLVHVSEQASFHVCNYM